MRAHVEAVRARVAAGTGKPAYLLHVPASPTFPYCIIAPGYGTGDEASLVGSDGLDMTVTVRAVAATADAALILADAARAALGAATPTSLTVTGWVAWLTWLRHEADYLDRGVTIPATATHPAISVDSYRLQAIPA